MFFWKSWSTLGDRDLHHQGHKGHQGTDLYRKVFPLCPSCPWWLFNREKPHGRTMLKTLAVARKEFRQIGRDRRTLLILLFVPAFILLIFGYALNFDIRHVRLAVDDRDHSIASRSLIAAFVNSGYFDLVASVDAAETTRLMDRDEVRAVLVIPGGFAR